MNLAEIVKPIALARGLFFTVEFSAKGGIKYTRLGAEDKVVHEDKSSIARYKTRKDVDHIGFEKWSRQIVNSAYNVMERHCSNTPLGYWIAEDKATAMLAEIGAVKEEAQNMNAAALLHNSQRRVSIEIYCMRAGQEDEEKVAKRLAQTVRERLESLMEDLRNGDLNAYATSWKKAKNLPRLATGIQAESIVFALEAARELRAKVAENIKEKRLEDNFARAAEGLDFCPIESAIVLFTDSVNGTLAQIEDLEAERHAA
jgi:hypothetical protein